jgi:hypothetical protein
MHDLALLQCRLHHPERQHCACGFAGLPPQLQLPLLLLSLLLPVVLQMEMASAAASMQ